MAKNGRLTTAVFCLFLAGLLISHIYPSRNQRQRFEMEKEKQAAWEQMTIAEHVALYEQQGVLRKEAMRLAAKDRGVSKRDIYQALLEDSDN